MALLTADRDQLEPALLWLHGFTQTSCSAPLFRSILAGSRPVHAPDLPGHGRAAPQRRSLTETAQDILADAPAIFDLGGYSLGGRIALHVALMAPERVRRLVLVSASMGIADESERATRRERDRLLAQRIRAEGASAFLEEWLSQPLFASLQNTDAEHRSRDGEGLASSLELCGLGTQEFLGPQLHRLTMPTLLLCGQNDEKFVAAAAQLHSLLPQSRVHVVPGGHALPLECPELLAELVGEFLSA